MCLYLDNQIIKIFFPLFSQRTSALISPTDLPDSPGCSTSDERHRIFEFTDKIPDADAHSLIRPRPAWPMGSLPSSDSLPSSVKRMSLESDVFTNSHEAMHSEPLTDKSNSAAAFNSSATSLTPPSRPQNSPLSPEKDQYSSQEVCLPLNSLYILSLIFF